MAAGGSSARAGAAGAGEVSSGGIDCARQPEGPAAIDAERRREADLHLALDFLPQLVWTAQANGHVDFCNRRWLDYTGLTLAASLGDGWARTIHPDDVSRTLATWRSAIDRGGDYECEQRLRGADGDYRWFLAHARPQRDAADQVVRWFGTSADIDGRKRMMEALRESEERLHLAQEAAGIGTWDWDLRTGAIRWSAQQYRMLGLDPVRDGADPYEAWLRILHPEDRAAADIQARAHSRRPGPVTMEFRIIRDGAVRWIRAEGKVVRDEQGRPERMVGINLDVSERRWAEQTLRELNQRLEQEVEERARQLAASRARLRAFFDNSPDWLTLIRAKPDGGFVFDDLNPTCEQAYGLPRDRVVGHSFEEVLGPEQAQIPLHHLRECVRTGLPQRYVAQRTMAERTYTIDVMFVLVPADADGGDRFIITAARDLTDREQLEEALRQSQRLEAVGQLTGGVAHDFNNLLTAIIGNLDLATTRAAPEGEMRGFIERALRSANRGARLTEQLLAFSRRQVLRPQLVDVNRVLDGMGELLRGAVGETVAISCALAEDLWTCRVDVAQFEAAVLNLAMNARDAMPNGGVLAIETRNEHSAGDSDLSPGDYVAIAVRDDGVGMMPETMAHAFEPFFTTKGPGKGSGLGLSMVYGFATQSGGVARLESEYSFGATVRLFLPRAEGQVDVDRDLRAAEAPKGTGAILLVEDDEDVRAVTVEILVSLGYRVLLAGDGPEALEILHGRQPVDILLSDVVMRGGMSGVELARRGRETRAGLKVILTSGYAAQHSAILAGAGAFPFIAKPFRPADLARLIRDMLDGLVP